MTFPGLDSWLQMNQGHGRLLEQKRVNPGPYRIQQLGRSGTLPARVLSENGEVPRAGH